MSTETKTDLDLNQQWEEAESKFKEMTSQSLKPSKQISFPEVLKILDDRFANAGNSVDQEKKVHVNETVLNVLECIQVCGGVAAQISSQVSSTQLQRRIYLSLVSPMGIE
jgi:hypothetical protein